MLALPEVLTHREARSCLRTLAAGVAGASGDELVVDAAALRHFDSSAVAVLLALRRLSGQAGKRLRVEAMPPHLRDLTQLYGVDGLFSTPG